MRGDRRARFCGECRLFVYNLSEFSRREIRRLLLDRSGRLCVRLFRRSDGTVMTPDCPVGRLWRRHRILSRAILAFGAVATLFSGLYVAELAMDALVGPNHSIRPLGSLVRAIQGEEGVYDY